MLNDSRNAEKNTASLALDPVVFERLAADVESFDVAYDFALAFLALLPGRIQRIDQALKARDREETVVALLSLRASAAMVGAAQLDASATRALAENRVQETVPGPLRRKLEGQADMFNHALRQLHNPHANTTLWQEPHHRTG